jgi:hypothetical protein
MKSKLAGLSPSLDSFEKRWEGVIQTIPQEEFVASLPLWMEHSEKCIRITSNYVKNNTKFMIV